MDIAITGIDCRFPGAADLQAFWDLLLRGGNGIQPVPAQRWDVDAFHAPRPAPGRMTTREGGFVSDADAFDHEFFSLTPAEAAAMDPQARMLLQAAWRALEDSGADAGTLARSNTGVYVGVMGNEWAGPQLADYAAITPHVGAGNGYCMTANRISYHLGLTGPSLAVDTACSSSLVAVHLAANALRSGECDRAVAAGVNLIVTPALQIFYTQAGLAAPDGRCKPFGANSDGIGRSEGVGVVVLRRLDEAIAAGEPIYAVIRGSAVNHDGRSNGLTAPNRRAQVEVMRRAYKNAGVEPHSVAFAEAHGTGTVLGDMIEAKALGELHGDRQEPCLLGSVKGNIGHAEGAAGIAALIKTVLALHHRVLPPTRPGSGENPQLRLARNGLRLALAPHALGDDEVLAAVSSFGLGGTNAHVVVATAPPVPQTQPVDRPVGVFTLSGNDLAAVRRNAAAAAVAIGTADAPPVSELCQASNRSKTSLPWRFGVAGDSREELVAALTLVAEDPGAAERLVRRPAQAPRIAYVFSGQGSQAPGMTRALYETVPAYRAALEEADAALAEHLGRSIIALILSEDEAVNRTGFTQPAVFAVQYALGRALAASGVTAEFAVGHSVGEIAAACLGGSLDLAQAARLVCVRAGVIDALPAGGGMLSIRATPDQLDGLLTGGVVIAALNGPRSTVLSGELEALEALRPELDARGLAATPLRVSHAFHSPLMEPALRPFRERMDGLQPAPGHWTHVSTVTGNAIAGDELDADYWTRHIAAPVRFAEAIEQVVALGATHLIEIGPRPVLSALLPAIDAARGLPQLAATSSRGSAADLARLLARLYSEGVKVRWDQASLGPAARLAPYVFSTAWRSWLDRTPAAPAQVEGPAAAVDTYAAVVAALCRVSGHDPDGVRPESRLAEDLGLDSVMLMTLKQELESRLPQVGAIDVVELLPHVATVASLVDHLDPAQTRA